MTSLRLAVVFLTRIPIGTGRGQAGLSRAVPWFPVVGAGVGTASAGVYALLEPHLTRPLAAALAIACLLIVGAVRLVRESVDILLEGAPRHLNLEEIRAEVGRIPGVASVHDLHIWTVSSGFLAMSAHIDLETGADPEHTRKGVHRLLHQQYAIEHTTIQTEATASPELLTISPPREN